MKNCIIGFLALLCLLLGAKEYGRTYLVTLYTKALSSFVSFNVATVILVREYTYISSSGKSVCLNAEDHMTLQYMTHVLEAAEEAIADARFYVELQRLFYTEETGMLVRTLVLSDYISYTKTISSRVDYMYTHMQSSDVIEYCVENVMDGSVST